MDAYSNLLKSKTTQALFVFLAAALSPHTAAANCMDSPLECKGITAEAVYTGEIWGNVDGGIDTGYDYIDNLDLTLEFDAEEALGWQGATFFAYAIANSKAILSDKRVGDSQGISNIAAPDELKIYELWYEQSLWDDFLNVKLGKYDLNSEFDVIETAGLFINGSHGIGADFSQAGRNGPSIFPSTALGARGRLAFTDTISLQSTVFNGVPDDPSRPSETKFGLDGPGILSATELDYEDENGTKIGIGYWIFTGGFDDVFEADGGGPIRHNTNDGFYVLGEFWPYREAGDRDQGLAAFARFGFADEDVNQFSNYVGGGLVYTGLFPGRDEDQLGLAVATAINGDPYKDSLRAAGGVVPDEEINIELSYRFGVMPWLTLQPDMQYVINPGAGANGDLDDALVVGMRFEILAFGGSPSGPPGRLDQE